MSRLDILQSNYKLTTTLSAGDEDCEEAKNEEADTPELGMGMANVGGVFLVLLIGLIVSIFVGVLEFLWNIRKVSIEERVSDRSRS